MMIISYRIVTSDPLVIELDLSTGSRIRVAADWGYESDTDLVKDRLATAIEKFSEAKSVRQWLAWWELQLLQSTPIVISADSIKYRQAVDLWNADDGSSWPDITEQLCEPRSEWKAFMQAVKRFARSNGYELREGKPGSKRKSQ